MADRSSCLSVLRSLKLQLGLSTIQMQHSMLKMCSRNKASRHHCYHHAR